MRIKRTGEIRIKLFKDLLVGETFVLGGGGVYIKIFPDSTGNNVFYFNDNCVMYFSPLVSVMVAKFELVQIPYED